MGLVPEEKLVLITTKKPILSPSSEKVEETLFPVDSDVDPSLEIKVKLVNMHQLVVPGEKYPRVSENMTQADFQKWKNSNLQEYSADRSFNKTGNKDVLVKNAYGTYRLNVPVTANDYLEEVTFFRLFVVTVFQSNKPYDVWVCLHKDTGSIVEGACSSVVE